MKRQLTRQEMQEAIDARGQRLMKERMEDTPESRAQLEAERIYRAEWNLWWDSH